MKCLVTAGNTQVMLDRVRCITNVFSGKTSTSIAMELYRRGHHVVLLTSVPELFTSDKHTENIRLVPFRTYDDLSHMMQSEITQGDFNAVIHCAAVSDYLAGGIYAPAAGSSFSSSELQWHASKGNPKLEDVSAGKVKSQHDELWLRLVKAPKLVDRIRHSWKFDGQLVKFKLEVGINQEQLETIAEASRVQSQADWMVANTLDGMHEWALLGPINKRYQKVARTELCSTLIDCLELNAP